MSEAGEWTLTLVWDTKIQRLKYLTMLFHILAAAFDYIETSLATYDDGPFLLGQFSLVSI